MKINNALFFILLLLLAYAIISLGSCAKPMFKVADVVTWKEVTPMTNQGTLGVGVVVRRCNRDSVYAIRTYEGWIMHLKEEQLQ